MNHLFGVILNHVFVIVLKYSFDRRPSVMTTLGEYLVPMATSCSDIRPLGDGASIYSSQTTLPLSRSIQSIGNDEVKRKGDGWGGVEGRRGGEGRRVGEEGREEGREGG